MLQRWGLSETADHGIPGQAVAGDDKSRANSPCALKVAFGGRWGRRRDLLAS